MEKSCGCIVFNNKKVLIVEQKSGFCGFPKGHIEDNETEIETAMRETKEETGIDVNIDKNKRYEISYLVHGNTPKTVVYYVAHTNNNDIKYQEDELNDAYFVDIEEVYNKLTFDNLKELWIEVLGDLNGKINI
ncbi:MAG: NUDIX domain-containing protein [Bacilli bacterium]|nr:NUDIX domain-containing protein [Bacilli bacterium]